MANRFNKAIVILKVTVTSLIILSSACVSRGQSINIGSMITPLAPTPVPAPPSDRAAYAPGQLVDYTAQNGDSLPALAARVCTTIDQIMHGNPIITTDANTMTAS